MKRWGIRARILFLAIAPSAMILVALVSYFTYARIAEVEVALRQQGSSIARQLAPAAALALFADDRAALQQLAGAAAQEKAVVRIAITDGQHRRVALAERSDPSEPADQLTFHQPVRLTRIPVAEIAEFGPADKDDGNVGDISVTMSPAAAHAERRRLLAIGAALGLACMLIAVALAFFVGNGVVEPIQRLAAAMVALGHGQPVPPLPISEGGELQTLAIGFEDMAARLRVATEELENRVDHATRALVAERDTAEQATKAKSRFLAAASHDLRQPLHAIELFTGTLQRRIRGGRLKPVVSDLTEAVGVMERLFDALLDISKLDAGALKCEIRPVALAPLFAHLAAEHADAAALKSLRLVTRPGRYVVYADELLLHRLLGNLVANAIRYTDEGTVLIACVARGSDVQIEVRDSGIGIPKEKQGEIFQEFVQIDNPARDRNLGLGLGLAIVARIARMLDTEVNVRSAPGEGSTFSLRLRRASDAPPFVLSGGAPAPFARAQARSRIAVLVIDDDPLVLSGNRALLETLGCDVTTVPDGEGARKAIAALSGRPVLILCDLWLAEGESGIDTLRRLSPLTTTVNSGILISGDTRPETIQAARAAGLTLLHKPLAAARLSAVVMGFASTVRAATLDTPR